jgi:DNA-directed RNA polymerase subunit RPC12/RpoP
MPHIIAKLLLAMVTMLGAPLLFLLIAIMLDGQRLGEVTALAVGAIFSLTTFAIVWTWLWKDDVLWTKRRIGRTAWWAGLSLLTSTMVAFLFTSMMPRFYEEIFFCVAAGLCYMMWIVSSILCWRETKAERGSCISRLSGKGPGVPCPTCGYDMTGLREAKCPECGSAFTLDQLYLAWRPEHEALSTEMDRN